MTFDLIPKYHKEVGECVIFIKDGGVGWLCTGLGFGVYGITEIASYRAWLDVYERKILSGQLTRQKAVQKAVVEDKPVPPVKRACRKRINKLRTYGPRYGSRLLEPHQQPFDCDLAVLEEVCITTDDGLERFEPVSHFIDFQATA